MKNFRVILTIIGLLLLAIAFFLSRLIVGDQDPMDLWVPILISMCLGSIVLVVGLTLFIAKAISNKYHYHK